MVRMAQQVRRGRRAIQARQELTGHRVLTALRVILGLRVLTGHLVLMVLRVILGLLALMGRPRMTWRLPTGLLAMRRRGSRR